MSSANPAIFLSYAREDTEAARRIAEALRGFGLEVWFDQSELRGGDAWDAKIKQQIRECALFVALVSAHTQARSEGYFRREWKLAVERTHDMAESRTFVLPVAIDDTPEKGALVPEQFLRVHWTRLPGGRPTPQFVAEVEAMLRTDRVGTEPLASGAPAKGTAPAVKKRRQLGGLVVVAGVAVLAGGGWWWTQRGSTSQNPAGRLAVEQRSLAVLPFTNFSDDKENAFFADGMHEDILTSLANFSDLKVIARTSVNQYRDTKKPIRQIGVELGVAYVLEGSVRRAGTTIRVTGQLIDARTEGHVWAQHYDREFELKDVFAMQSELSTEIVRALHVVLSPQDKARLDQAPTQNSAAYDLYLQGRDALRRPTNTRDQLAKAEPLLTAAVKLDPGFARAWRTLASLHTRAFTTLDQSEARLAQVKACIDTAVRLAPDDPDVMLGLGSYFEVSGNLVKATELYQRVVRAQPNNIDVLSALSSVSRREGRWAEALANARRSRTLDPQSPDTRRRLYGTLMGLAAKKRCWSTGADEAGWTCSEGIDRASGEPTGVFASAAVCKSRKKAEFALKR